MDVPRTRFAWNGDVALAYQVIGQRGVGTGQLIAGPALLGR